MMKNLKGVSPVVSIILIIFVTLGAVFAFNSFLSKNVRDIGNDAGSGAICGNNYVEILKCRQFDSGETNVDFKINLDSDKVDSIAKINLNIFYEDGSSTNEDVSNLAKKFENGLVYGISPKYTNKVDEVAGVFILNLRGGGIVSCVSPPARCEQGLITGNKGEINPP